MIECDRDQSSSIDDAHSIIPKNLRVRYWNSWEEMKLIEFWRKYSSEITTLQKNIPIFRTISEKMRMSGFQVNPQECRRKINVLKNKYIAERRRLELSDDYPLSEWKLYPLVHCLLVPMQKTVDLNHQETILGKLMLEIPPREESASAMQTKAKGGFPGPKPTYRIPQDLTVGAHSLTGNSEQLQSSGPLPATRRPYERRKKSFVRRYMAFETLEQLREDNRRLCEQRDQHLKILIIEENEYLLLESFLKKWKQQYEDLLQQIESSVDTADKLN